ncbi:anti-anti-sigma factor [Bacterioplanes sanyensis]|uniref:Anti-anti-sigma factor n=1 Tax=Bacterioplanes sanyensis TaxID=1249553 RepID=A0A222FKZ6_9GAMM|nr:sigma-E factor negative regulatory protein [Bacterioplanes sanyensis]ASP39194.1 anti-anti-sigma factor [Bacterioplanes sanyensis]
MQDRLKETLSALKDGQAEELELRRLLNEMENEPELRDTWARYQMMGALMRDEPISTVDLSRGIRQAIDGEPMDEVPAVQEHIAQSSGSGVSHAGRSLPWQQWLTGGAVAASVTLAVLLGVRLDSVQPAGGSAAVAAAPAPTNPVEATTPVQSNAVQVAAVEAAPAAQSAAELSDAQRQLQEYVLQHTEHAALNTGRGVMPFARVASFPEREAEERRQ